MAQLTTSHLAWILSIVRDHKREPLTAKDIQHRMDSKWSGDDVHLLLWQRLLASLGVK
jgi:hypothetical protein